MVAGGQKLSSWKEIAAYLHCDESTARRWERKARLPVYRVGGSRGSSVYAYTEEIDAWLRGQSSAALKSHDSSVAASVTVPENGAPAGHCSLDTSPRSGEIQRDASERLSVGMAPPVETGIQGAEMPFRSGPWKYGLVGLTAVLLLGITSLWWGPFRITSRPLSKPRVVSVDPSVPIRRNLDQTITVYGGDFQDGMTVTVYYPGGIGRLSGTQLQDINSSSFQMIVLLGIPGEYSIVVNNPDGTHSNRFSFQVKRESLATAG